MSFRGGSRWAGCREVWGWLALEFRGFVLGSFGIPTSRAKKAREMEHPCTEGAIEVNIATGGLVR